MNTIFAALDTFARFSGLGIHNHILQVESWPRFFLMATVWSVIVLTASGFAGYYYTRSLCKA